MTNYANEQKIGENSLEWEYGSSDFTEITTLVYLLEIITKVGRHFPIIFLSLASLSVLLATNDFLANSVEFGVLNSLFAVGGFVSVIQIHQKTKTQPFNPNNNEINPKPFLGIVK